MMDNIEIIRKAIARKCPVERFSETLSELEADIITLVLRLKGEDPDTFSPEVAGVMAKWLPEIDAAIVKEVKEKWTK